MPTAAQASAALRKLADAVAAHMACADCHGTGWVAPALPGQRAQRCISWHALTGALADARALLGQT